MRRALVTISATILLAACSFAASADEASGVIVSIDMVAGTVTLDDGQTFILTETIDPTTLEIGQNVSVTYETTPDGVNAATVIAPLT